MDEQLFRLEAVLSNKASYDYAVMATDFHAAVEDVLRRLEDSPNTTYFSVKQINLYKMVNGVKTVIRRLAINEY